MVQQRHYPGICLNELRKTMKTCQDSRYPDRYLNQASPDYKFTVLSLHLNDWLDNTNNINMYHTLRGNKLDKNCLG
jgi:hypothetical protein